MDHLQELTTQHYLVGHYVTNSPEGGVCVQARCTCRQKFEGIGKDGTTALDSLWKAYADHLSQAEKLQESGRY
ncbi:MAG: hypothetical protein ACOYYS_22625 [Chloroflexota bacterium]